MEYPTQQNQFLAKHAQLLNESYKRLLFKALLENTDSDKDLAIQLFHAPFALVSHDTSSDPIFNYANLKALELFELNWSDFTQVPSRLSAEPINQTERARLLAEVTQKGFIGHYEGIRISSTLKRFMIKNAVVWNLTTPDGLYQGQAACFAEWTFLNNV